MRASWLPAATLNLVKGVYLYLAGVVTAARTPLAALGEAKHSLLMGHRPAELPSR